MRLKVGDLIFAKCPITPRAGAVINADESFIVIKTPESISAWDYRKDTILYGPSGVYVVAFSLIDIWATKI